MKLPRRLCRTSTGELCEETHPDSAILVGPKGMEFGDAEADRLGITAYYAEMQDLEAKEQKRQAFEDKALHPVEPPPPATYDPGVLAPGMHVDPAMRRGAVVPPGKK